MTFFKKRKDEEGLSGTWWQVWEAEKQNGDVDWLLDDCVATFRFENHASKFVEIMNAARQDTKRGAA